MLMQVLQAAARLIPALADVAVADVVYAKYPYPEVCRGRVWHCMPQKTSWQRQNSE
jgi:hypothetical protein